MNIRVLLLCSAFALLSGAAAPLSAADSKTELLNPNFDSDDWFFQDAQFESSEGANHVVLNGVEPGPKSWSHVGTRIEPVPIDHQLVFSCQLRGTHSNQHAMVNTFAYDSSERLLKYWSKTSSIKENVWTPFTASYVVPSNTNKLTLWVINRTKHPAQVSQPSMVVGAYAKSQNARPKKRSASSSNEKKTKKDDYKYDEHIQDWIDYTAHNAYEIGIDKTVHHSGSASAYMKSIGPKPADEFGNLMQAIVPNNYLDQRVKLTAWIKTQLTSGAAQLWMRVDGEWNKDTTKPGTFDNMDDRPIKGNTDWREYSIVVDVPPTGNHVTFGLMHLGTGTIWLDDVSLTRVGKDVPLTGSFTTLTGCGKREPVNMGFEGAQK